MPRHLDLGCGNDPKNPYSSEELFGIDIRDGLGANIVPCNLSIQAIPFPDNYFDSLSAYDFLEHIPRVVVDLQSQSSFFPFIQLMNEVFRVLRPGGMFYAVTPVYPSHKVFMDPTHVNFLSRKSHEYFTGDTPLARMYGYTGSFRAVRVRRIRPRSVYEPRDMPLTERIRRFGDVVALKRSHVLWEFSKVEL